MHGRRAAAGAGRTALQCVGTIAVPRPPLPTRPSPAPAEAVDIIATRSFASGPHFEGFPFGSGFPGGFQRPQSGDTDSFYRLLDIEKDATEQKIKSAYKKKAMQCHPDRGGDENEFKKVSRAYEVLSDPQKRQLYDTYGEEGLENAERGGGSGPSAGADPFDLFSQIFGFNVGGQQRRGKPRTPDATYELQLTLEELYSGTSREIAFTRDALCTSCNGVGGHDRRECSHCNGSGVKVSFQQMGPFVQQVQTPCAPCGGKGWVIPADKVCKVCMGRGVIKAKKTFRVEVPPGIQDGAEFRYKGQADEAYGHDTGDVVINVREKPHKVFHRTNESLVMSKRISLAEALCGFEFSTTYLDGTELLIRSKDGQVSKPGDMMILHGKGMPRPHGQKPGDLHLILEVDFPTSFPSEKQAKLLDALDSAPLSDTPPPGAEIARTLTKSQSQALKQKWREAARRRQDAGQQGTCVHQ